MQTATQTPSTPPPSPERQRPACLGTGNTDRGTPDLVNPNPVNSCLSQPAPNQPDNLEHLGEQIAEIHARITAATYQLLALIRDFDERGGWHSAYSGFATCAHWLSWRTGLALGASREHVRVARALGELPVLSEAMRRGRVSYSKIRALTRVATPDNERELLDFALAGTAAHVERLVHAWRRVDRQEACEQEALRHASRYLNLYTDEDGMVVVRARLDPEAGAALVKAVEAGCDLLYEAEKENEATNPEAVPAAQRRADALGRVAEAALAGGLDKGTRGDRYQVVVHVEAAVLGEAGAADVPAGTPEENGDWLRFRQETPSATSAPPRNRCLSPLSAGDVPAGTPETAQRLACDASRVLMTHDPAGNVLDVGRKTRTIPPALRRALDHRDQTCRFPGCSVTFCDAHHVRHWARGGETRLDNLVLLCRRHHRCVHEEGWRVEVGQEGGFRFLTPDGASIFQAPHLPRLEKEPLVALAESLARSGVDLERLGGDPEWDGSAPDLAWAVGELRSPRAFPRERLPSEPGPESPSSGRQGHSLLSAGFLCLDIAPQSSSSR